MIHIQTHGLKIRYVPYNLSLYSQVLQFARVFQFVQPASSEGFFFFFAEESIIIAAY